MIAILGLVLLVGLILLAIRLISARHTPDEENQRHPSEALIHASGIYSIIHRSPREELINLRPQESEIRKYLASINEDMRKQPLSGMDKQKLVEDWKRSMEENICVVEQGDCENAEFYYYDFPENRRCPVCASRLNRDIFIARQDIFKNPSFIPPFHLGCTTRIIPYRSKERIKETPSHGITASSNKTAPPPIDEWTTLVKLP